MIVMLTDPAVPGEQLTSRLKTPTRPSAPSPTAGGSPRTGAVERTDVGDQQRQPGRLLEVRLGRHLGVRSLWIGGQCGQAPAGKGQLVGQPPSVVAQLEARHQRATVAVVGPPGRRSDPETSRAGSGPGRGGPPAARRLGRARRIGLAADRAVLDEPVVAAEAGHRGAV